MCTALGTFLNTNRPVQRGSLWPGEELGNLFYFSLQNPNLSKLKWSFERADTLWTVGSKGVSRSGC